MSKPLTKSIRALGRPTVWSNLVFLAPLVFAFSFGNTLLVLVIAAVLVDSVIYHFTSEKTIGASLAVDRTTAAVLILFNAGLVAFGGFTPPYVYWVFLLVGVALYLYRVSHAAWRGGHIRNYELYHSLWHAASAAITTFAILTFYL